jgi:hypothetical protein
MRMSPITMGTRAYLAGEGPRHQDDVGGRQALHAGGGQANLHHRVDADGGGRLLLFD